MLTCIFFWMHSACFLMFMLTIFRGWFRKSHNLEHGSCEKWGRWNEWKYSQVIVPNGQSSWWAASYLVVVQSIEWLNMYLCIAYVQLYQHFLFRWICYLCFGSWTFQSHLLLLCIRFKRQQTFNSAGVMNVLCVLKALCRWVSLLAFSSLGVTGINHIYSTISWVIFTQIKTEVN